MDKGRFGDKPVQSVAREAAAPWDASPYVTAIRLILTIVRALFGDWGWLKSHPPVTGSASGLQGGSRQRRSLAQVTRELLERKDAGHAFSSLRKEAGRIGCSSSTVNTALETNHILKNWANRGRSLQEAERVEKRRRKCDRTQNVDLLSEDVGGVRRAPRLSKTDQIEALIREQGDDDSSLYFSPDARLRRRGKDCARERE